jgi:hypothetical protein
MVSIPPKDSGLVVLGLWDDDFFLFGISFAVNIPRMERKTAKGQSATRIYILNQNRDEFEPVMRNEVYGGMRWYNYL